MVLALTMKNVMQPIQFGGIIIDRVVELRVWPFPANRLFPSISAETFENGRGWLDDRFIDPITKDLILGVHSYVLRVNGRIILIDTCNGNHKNRPALPALHQLNTPYLENLARAGLCPEDIDIVMCTHLHPDHCGWNTRLVDGRWVPTFPNATYLMSSIEFEHLQSFCSSKQENALRQDMSTTFEDSVLPVVKAGQAIMVNDNHIIEHEIGDGVWMESASGHTPGHVIVHAKQSEEHAIMTGDIIHHPIQFGALDMPNASDFDPIQAAATRQRLIKTYADTNTLILTGHFPGPTAGRIVTRNEGLRFEWLT